MSTNSPQPFGDVAFDPTVEIPKHQPAPPPVGSGAELEVTENLPLTSGEVGHSRVHAGVPAPGRRGR